MRQLLATRKGTAAPLSRLPRGRSIPYARVGGCCAPALLDLCSRLAGRGSPRHEARRRNRVRCAGCCHAGQRAVDRSGRRGAGDRRGSLPARRFVDAHCRLGRSGDRALVRFHSRRGSSGKRSPRDDRRRPGARRSRCVVHRCATVRLETHRRPRSSEVVPATLSRSFCAQPSRSTAPLSPRTTPSGLSGQRG
jgi:hypothetical protein